MRIVQAVKDSLPREIKLGSLITPLAFALITAGVIFIPAERSGWDASGVIISLSRSDYGGLFAVFAIALNVQWGYTGIFNFGIAAFFMIGAYTAALFTLPPPRVALSATSSAGAINSISSRSSIVKNGFRSLLQPQPQPS